MATSVIFFSWIVYSILTGDYDQNQQQNKQPGGSGVYEKIFGEEILEPVRDITTKFKDVQGIDEFKEELEELVSFLKHPEKYIQSGVTIPKGVLLSGLPGTGKTLLGKAVAGEAGVPFYYKSGSEFDEVFVGRGAKRVRKLFSEARANAPAIIFIDEIDAVAGKRNSSQQNSRDTLNQILCEMDGFKSNDQVIVIGATNLKGNLDKAILRPGRFDKIIDIPLPNKHGREKIFELYLHKIKVDEKTITADNLAKQTTGFSGADIKNLVNTAMMMALRGNRTIANLRDFEAAIDRILIGVPRKKQMISKKDKLLTAYHESGHTLCCLLTKGAVKLYKVTILPSGNALGFTSYLPEENQLHSFSKTQMLARIDCLMAGRIGEELHVGKSEVTTGCSDDLQKATQLAYSFVREAAFVENVNWIIAPKS